MQSVNVVLEPLTHSAFCGYGDIIAKEHAERLTTNQGTATRYHDLARIEITEQNGRGLVSIFEVTTPVSLPFRLRLMERHPISSQAFIPLSAAPFLVVVAQRGPVVEVPSIRAFLTNGKQGVNFHPAIWHHPLIALQPGDFIVIDRTGPGSRFDQDYEEVLLKNVNVTVVSSSG